MFVKHVTPREIYVLRLTIDEHVFDSILAFCTERGVHYARLSGIGAIKNAKVGYYDLKNKEYFSKEYSESLEVVSLVGNITRLDGRPFLHAHVVLSDRENRAIGGHLFSADVAVTLEITIDIFEESVAREFDECTGLKLMKI